MSKWQRKSDPTEDAAMVIVAALLPGMRAQRDTLLATWRTEGFPAPVSRALHQMVINPGLESHGVERAAPVWSLASAMLANDLEKPVLAAYHAQRRAEEQAAEARVDTNRPVVATCVESQRERVGALAIVRMADRRERVLVCIRSTYESADMSYDDEAGYYTDYAEPSETEQQSAEYQRLSAQIAAHVAEDAAYRAAQEARAAAHLAKMRASGGEPDVFDELFAGTSDN